VSSDRANQICRKTAVIATSGVISSACLKLLSALAIVCGFLAPDSALAEDRVTAADEPIILLVENPLRKEAFDSFLSIMQKNVKESRREGGNIFFNAYQPEDGSAVLFMVECWKNQAAFDLHLESPHLAAVKEAYRDDQLPGGGMKVFRLKAISPEMPRKTIASPETTRNVIVILHVKPEARSAFMKALLKSVQPARAAAGNISFDIYQDEADTNTLVLVERWESVAAHEAFFKQSYDNALKELTEASLAKPLSNERYVLRDVGH